MVTKELKKQFYQAKHDLEQLENELPNFEALLADNQAEEAKLRQEKADLSALAAAKGRVNVARELLEQHHSDIETARAEVERLEAAYQHERTLDEMAEYAREAERQRQAFEAAITEANEALRPHAERMLEAWTALRQARSNFLRTGRGISAAFGYSRWPLSVSDEKVKEYEQAATMTLEAIKNRGAPLETVLVPWGASGPRTMLDLDRHKPLLEPEPFNEVLWQAVRALQERHYQQERAKEMAAAVAATSSRPAVVGERA